MSAILAIGLIFGVLLAAVMIPALMLSSQISSVEERDNLLE